LDKSLNNVGIKH